MSTQRERFEEFSSAQEWPDLTRQANGNYAIFSVQRAWKSWIAAEAQQSEALKGAAIIADAAGAEIRVLKAKVAELEATIESSRPVLKWFNDQVWFSQDRIAELEARLAGKKGGES